MTADPVTGAVVLGFVLGLQHATDPDHLVAVATIVTRERRFRGGALIGLVWGLGHWMTLTVAGGVLVLLQIRLRPEVGTVLELLVAAVIVGLGLLRLWEAWRGFAGAPRAHLLADHQHPAPLRGSSRGARRSWFFVRPSLGAAGDEAFHSHAHSHGADAHAHPHVHPSQALLGALARGRPVALRALLVGAVHGLAGTAAVSLLVLTTMRSPLGALLYLAVFGIGTLAGMTALTAALVGPVALTVRFQRAHRVLGLGAGVGAIVFGIIYAARAL